MDENIGTKWRERHRALHKTTGWATTGQIYRFTEILPGSLKLSVTFFFLYIIIAHSRFSFHSLSASCVLYFRLAILLLLCIRVFGGNMFIVLSQFSHEPTVCKRKESFVEFATQGSFTAEMSTIFEWFFEHFFFLTDK